MRRLHLLIDFPNDPRRTKTHCGIETDDDSIDWTYDRKRVLGHRFGCKKCLKESTPEQRLPAGHAAAELDKLEQFNRLHRNPQAYAPSSRLEQAIIQCIEGDDLHSATLIAIELNKPVSEVTAELKRMYRDGVVSKSKRHGWCVVDEPIRPYFKLVNPESLMAGRIVIRKS
jgi:hypothetical protein